MTIEEYCGLSAVKIRDALQDETDLVVLRALATDPRKNVGPIARRRLAKLGAVLGDGLLDETGTYEGPGTAQGIALEEALTVPPPEGPVRTMVVDAEGNILAADLDPERANVVAIQKANDLDEVVFLVDPSLGAGDKGLEVHPFGSERAKKPTIRRKKAESKPEPEPEEESDTDEDEDAEPNDPTEEEDLEPEGTEEEVAGPATTEPGPKKRGRPRAESAPAGFDGDDERECPRCGEELPTLEGFGYRQMKPGKWAPQPHCRSCRHAASQLSKVEDPEALRKLIRKLPAHMRSAARRRLAKLDPKPEPVVKAEPVAKPKRKKKAEPEVAHA